MFFFHVNKKLHNLESHTLTQLPSKHKLRLKKKKKIKKEEAKNPF